MIKFKIVQLKNGRYQIHVANPDDYRVLPQHIALALLWRSYATINEAATDATNLLGIS